MMDFLMLMTTIMVLFGSSWSKIVNNEANIKDVSKTSPVSLSSTTDYCNRHQFEQTFQSKGKPVGESIVRYMSKTCENKQCLGSRAYPFWTFVGTDDVSNAEYSFGILNATKEDYCWYYLLELESIMEKRIIFRKYYRDSMHNMSTVKENGNLTERSYGDRFIVKLTVFPSGKKIIYPCSLPDNSCEVLAIHVTIKYYRIVFMNTTCKKFDHQKNVFEVANEFCDHYNNPSKSFIKENLEKNLYYKDCSIYLKLRDIKKEVNKTSSVKLISTTDYCNRHHFEQEFQSKGKPVAESIVSYMRNTCKNDKCILSPVYPFWSFVGTGESISNAKYSFGLFNVFKDNDCWYYLLELDSVLENKTIFRKYYRDSNNNMSTIKEYGNLTERYYGDRFIVKLTVFPSGTEMSYPYLLPSNLCEILAIHLIIKFYWKHWNNEICPQFYDQRNVFGVAKVFCDHFNNPSESFIKENLEKNLHRKYCSIYIKLRDIKKEVNKKSSVKLISTTDYCNRLHFEEEFQSKGKPVAESIVRYMRDTCKNDKCILSPAYPFWSFVGTGESISNAKYSFGLFSVFKDNDCWYYLLELDSVLENKTIFRKYYRDSNNNMSTIKEFGNLTERYYGDRFIVKLTVFPSGKEMSYPYPLPSNICEILAIYRIIKFYWKRFNNKTCPLFYDQKNVFGVAKQFCDLHKNPSESFIKENLEKNLEKRYCTIYLKFDVKNVDTDRTDGVSRNERYLWIALSFLTIFVFSVITYKFYMSRKQSSKRRLFVNSPVTQSPSRGQRHLPIDSKISVMILHRPGCEILDRLVRDFSFVIHSYGIEVTSPLLEMSQIDAEGGIATYIQRNIDKCSYILVIVTDNVTETVHRNHKPFEFSIKILSGLAFRSNECSRYIPIYFKEYKDIIKDIPAFLSASTNCGYKIPNQIKNLVVHMTQTDTIVQDKNSSQKLSFFLEKIKAQVKTLLADKHKGCCKGQCEQGTISDDISELWPTETSTTTNRIIDDVHSISCRSNLLPVKEQLELPLHGDALCVDINEEEKVKQWQQSNM